MTLPSLTSQEEERDEALHELQTLKIRFGPSYESCFAESEYLEAAWKVVEINQPLISWTLKSLSVKRNFDDLATSLKLTMFRCCYIWEPSLGKFSTYAVASMRFTYFSAVSELAQLDKPIALPVNLRTVRGRESSRRNIQEDIVKLVKTSQHSLDIEEGKAWDREADGLVRRLKTIERAEAVSLIQAKPSYRVSDEDGIEWGTMSEAERVPDEVDVAEEATTNIIAETLRKIVSDSLSVREAMVLDARFGLGMGFCPYEDVPVSLTLEEIASWLGVTRERIRQIEAKALRMLRHPSRSHAYKVS